MLILQVSTSYTSTSTVASVVCTPSGKKSIFFGKDDDVVDDGNVDDDDAVANDAFESLWLSVLILVKTL